MNAIQIEKLTKIFPPLPFSRQPSCVALKEVTLEIKQGTLYTILGPNGAGKSTLIRILAGLIPVSAGSVKINGIPVSQKKQAKTIGLFMSGGQSFWGFLTGWQNLEYFCALQNIVGYQAQKKIREMVDLFEMGSYVRRPTHAYSNGMKHRLLLARTMLNDPEILLLDEPVTYLDPVAAREFHLLLRKQLNQSLKKTIFLSTHQLEEAQEISDTLGFLLQGTLVWEKNAEVFRSRQANLLDEYLQTVRGRLA